MNTKGTLCGTILVVGLLAVSFCQTSAAAEVEVTVASGRITDVTVLSSEDDRQYFSRAQSSLIAAILNAQGVDVSAVSGATFSSNGILEAVADALDIDFTNPNAAMSRGKGRKPRRRCCL